MHLAQYILHHTFKAAGLERVWNSWDLLGNDIWASELQAHKHTDNDRP